MSDLSPERVDELAEVLAEHRLHASMNICTGCDWRATPGVGSLAGQHEAHRAEALAPLVARWVAEADLTWQVATGDPTPAHAKVTTADLAASMEELARQRDEARDRGAAEVRARVDAEMREGVTLSWITPALVHRIRAAMTTNPTEEQR